METRARLVAVCYCDQTSAATSGWSSAASLIAPEPERRNIIYEKRGNEEVGDMPPRVGGARSTYGTPASAKFLSSWLRFGLTSAGLGSLAESAELSGCVLVCSETCLGCLVNTTGCPGDRLDGRGAGLSCLGRSGSLGAGVGCQKNCFSRLRVRIGCPGPGLVCPSAGLTCLGPVWVV